MASARYRSRLAGRAGKEVMMMQPPEPTEGVKLTELELYCVGHLIAVYLSRHGDDLRREVPQAHRALTHACNELRKAEEFLSFIAQRA